MTLPCRAALATVALVAALAGPAAAQGGGAERDSALASMVRAELAFAEHAAREGVRDAFVAWLADGAVMFAPDPVDGRAFYVARPESGAQLAWYPSLAGISAGGDLGFTTGPSEFRPDPADTLVFHGHFASVWRRQPDGGWKVELDMGVGHPRPGRKPRPLDPARLPAVPAPWFTPETLSDGDLESLRSRLVALDSAFARTAAHVGTGEAMDQLGAEDVRIQRAGQLPITGRRRTVQFLARATDVHWAPLGGGVARSGDLGYTWGAVRTEPDAATPAGYYLRVWSRQRGTGWRIVLDVVAPREP